MPTFQDKIAPYLNRVLVGDALATLRSMPAESAHCVVTSVPSILIKSDQPGNSLSVDRPRSATGVLDEQSHPCLASVPEGLSDVGSSTQSASKMNPVQETSLLEAHLRGTTHEPESMHRTSVLLTKTNSNQVVPKSQGIIHAPWARILRKTGEENPAHKGSSFSAGKTGEHQQGRASEQTRTMTEPAGWAPSCTCGIQERIPAVVLDPFIGSGTTAIVALGLGRNYVGIELNPEYAAIAERRIHNEVGLLKGQGTL